MRHAPISIAAATAIFVLGVFIINIQVWYSARADSLAGAHYVVRNMHVILTEAHHATQVAMRLAENECDAEGQYRLGTEAALQPHLRTIVILKKDVVWCSSLPGNRVLLVNGSALPEAPLLLVPSKSTVNGLPVLLYQTNHAGSRIMVSISDSHIRDALNMPLRGVAYSLLVGNRRLGQSGDVLTAAHSNNDVLTVKAADYAFAIQFNAPPLFSLTRLFDQAGGVLLFLLFVSSLSAYLLQRYLSKDISPEESLRTAIYRNEIIPYYQPVVSGKEGTLRGVEVLARWKHPQSGFISPSSFIPLAEKTGLIIPLTQSLMRQVATQMNAISTLLPEGFHVGINFSASHIVASTFFEECLNYKRSFVQQDLNLVVEVTEREPLHVDEHLVKTLNALHEIGFAIALDDFGTGYSGLSYLQDLHIDYIKIDQSFVARVNENEDSTLILDSVLELAKNCQSVLWRKGLKPRNSLITSCAITSRFYRATSSTNPFLLRS